MSQESTCAGVSLYENDFIKIRLQHRYFLVKFAKFSRTRILNNICQRLLLWIWFLGVIAYKCGNAKNENLNLTFFSLPRNRKIAKIWKNRINRTDLPKIIALCEEHRGESCFNKSADLGRKLMNTKD